MTPNKLQVHLRAEWLFQTSLYVLVGGGGGSFGTPGADVGLPSTLCDMVLMWAATQSGSLVAQEMCAVRTAKMLTSTCMHDTTAGVFPLTGCYRHASVAVIASTPSHVDCLVMIFRYVPQSYTSVLWHRGDHVSQTCTQMPRRN